jgi:hypothetical protein
MIKKFLLCFIAALLCFTTSCKTQRISDESKGIITPSNPESAYENGFSVGYDLIQKGYAGGTPRVPDQYRESIADWRNGYIDGQRKGLANQAQANQ